jgi:hypothetical protein
MQTNFGPLPARQEAVAVWVEERRSSTSDVNGSIDVYLSITDLRTAPLLTPAVSMDWGWHVVRSESQRLQKGKLALPVMRSTQDHHPRTDAKYVFKRLSGASVLSGRLPRDVAPSSLYVRGHPKAKMRHKLKIALLLNDEASSLQNIRRALPDRGF